MVGPYVSPGQTRGGQGRRAERPLTPPDTARPRIKVARRRSRGAWSPSGSAPLRRPHGPLGRFYPTSSSELARRLLRCALRPRQESRIAQRLRRPQLLSANRREPVTMHAGHAPTSHTPRPTGPAPRSRPEEPGPVSIHHPVTPPSYGPGHLRRAERPSPGRGTRVRAGTPLLPEMRSGPPVNPGEDGANRGYGIEPVARLQAEQPSGPGVTAAAGVPLQVQRQRWRARRPHAWMCAALFERG